MKKTLLAVVAVLAMTSCSQNEIDGIDNGKQNGKAEIKFGYTPVTRATVITTGDLNNFKVSAYANADAYNAEQATTIINDDEFSKSGDEWKSTTVPTPIYYWPTGQKMHFFGYTNVAGTTFTKGDTGYPTLQYTIETTVTSQSDLLVAKLGSQTYSNTTVSLPFKHALTQVLFKLKGDDETVTYKVKSVSIKGVIKDGTYDYENEKWTEGSAKEESGYSAIKETTVNGVTTVELGTTNETILMLMPQTIPSGAKIVVTYSATKEYTVGIATEIHSDTTPVEVDLTGTWEKGKKMTYTLVLSGDKVKIAGTVASEDDWAVPTTDGGDIDVNK